MGWTVVLEVLKWGGLILLAGFILQFGKSLVLQSIKKKKKKVQEELEKAKINEKSEKIHKETIEILSTLEKIKAQAILDKKTNKYKNKKTKTSVKTLKKDQNK